MTDFSLVRRFYRSSLAFIAALFMMCGTAGATVIYTGTMNITAGDPTQLGRVSRNGVVSDWSAPKAFTGMLNTSTSYHYTTLDLDLTALESGFNYGGFIQVDFDSETPNTFITAYLDNYNPANPGATYLGDPGLSGNQAPGDPAFFQFSVLSGHHLVLVLEDTTSNGAGLNQPGGLTVEAFGDTEYTDLTPIRVPPSVPEPSTLLLLVPAMAPLFGRRLLARKAA